MRASPLPFSLSAVLLIGLVGSSPTIRVVDGGVDQSLDRPVWMKLLSASASFSAVESNSSASLTVIHGPSTAAPSTQAEDEQLDSDLPTTRILQTLPVQSNLVVCELDQSVVSGHEAIVRPELSASRQQ